MDEVMRSAHPFTGRGAILVTLAILFVLAASGSTHAASSASFVDPSGVSITDSVDITTVSVSSDDSGNVHFQISTPNSASQANGGGLEVDIDSDLNGTTDYLVDYPAGAGTPLLYKCSPGATTCQNWTAPSFHGSYSNGPIFDVNRIVIGAQDVTRIQFKVYTLYNDPNYYYDRAPDTGWYVYDIGPSITTVTVDPTSVTPSPSRPQAGQNFTVSFNAKSNSGAPLPSGTVDCAASVGGTSLTGSGSFSSGTGSCTWQIPGNAGGKQFVAHGTVSYPGATTNGVFDLSAVVVGQASLRLGAVTKTQLLAGKSFTLGVAVLVHQAGIADTRMQQGAVGCRATVGGRTVRVTKTHVTSGKGVQCTWSVPKTARGKTFHAVVTVRSEGLSVQHAYSFPVH
jgi:hypothetical protein